MNERISLGLDIGVASVGFSVLNIENGKILELGSRLFNATVAEENQTRRDRRGSRRLLRRQRQRRIDAARLLYQVGLIKDFSEEDFAKTFRNNWDPYQLRVQGLTQKLTMEQLANALYHLVKRRGISYALADADDEDNDNDYSASLQVNQKALQDQTPAQIQLARLQKYGQVRGRIDRGGSEIPLLNVFPNGAYIREAQMIIQCQRQYYPTVLTTEFEKQYLDILRRKRNYFVGPGSEKSRTDYGIYKTSGQTLNNLFEELIGHDSIYKDQLRAAAVSYTAQLFNVLNDLNNLTIATYEDGKMPPADKQKIIDSLRSSTKATSMMTLIKKVAHCQTEDIRGYRLNPKTDKPEFSSMDNYRKVHRTLVPLGVDINGWPNDFYDQLSFIMTLNTEDGEIRRRLVTDLQPKYAFLTDETIQILIDQKHSFDITSNNKWHRFSLKTMRRLIPEMLQQPKEQMTLLTEMGLVHPEHKHYQDYKYLPYKQIAADIFNPVASKAVREALKIVNAVLKKYGEIEDIVIEMPRDDNAEDEKKQIKKFQADNAKTKDKALEAFINALGDRQAVKNRLNGKLMTQIRLWYLQDGKCLYSGQNMLPEDILSNSGNFDIDHIIPQSISYDDSLNNKTLCFKAMNDQKGQKTPYEFMTDGGGQGWAEFKAQVNRSNRLSKIQKKNLLFDENVQDIEVRKRFISRNLVDTRYASRVVLNSLQDFFRGREKPTKVTVIRGKFTSNMRKHWHLNKSRETFHHHAVDASIIAVTPFLRVWKKGRTIFPVKVGERTIDIETGELLDDQDFAHDLLAEPYNNFVTQLQKIEPKIKFSHQVDKKMNRRVSKDTIYSVRSTQLGKDKHPTDYLLRKTDDLYTVKGYEDFQKVYKKDPQQFLLAQIDPRSFQRLVEIVENYPDSQEVVDNANQVKQKKISPFELYRREHGCVRKYAKHNNGPLIRNLKYYYKKLGSNIDITPTSARNKKVVLLSLNPWRTDVYWNPDTRNYEIMGLKYSDLEFIKDTQHCGITRKNYQQIKKQEGVSDNSEFKFSLFRNDRIKVANPDTGEMIEMRFWSRTKPSQKGYTELKPLDAYVNQKDEIPVYGKVKKEKQIQKPLVPKGCKIWKISTDILGKPFCSIQEGPAPKDIID
ncbi:type II CRISPR RNA-guided endonuclease Cas9 [Lactobacillus sp. DCY120]|uniref:CRISPR-associated endonuclease Cas9 n=1 Tax=Bombilactobacillus apium TaxID=2675299 RepID=A0A850R195_9LACO|nr:type II CRISPR RNA-guided endonuclease Cas9 [Bombilactobacillus apium]NVY96869.1 type II CRISPR RNA-guided endonuclease Cas9 [Bombilactobacillus apium]